MNAAEQRTMAKIRGNEQVGKSLTTPAASKIPRAEAAKIERLRDHLYAFMAAGAVALLLVLSIALTGAPPQPLSLALVAVAVATWWFTDEVATVLPLVVAGLLAHIPEEVWNPPAEGEA